jgi:uncharacterized protein YdaT
MAEENKTKLMETYEEETGKKAVWQGSVTKGFKDWKDNLKTDTLEDVSEEEVVDNTSNKENAGGSLLSALNDKIDDLEQKIELIQGGRDDRFKKDAKKEDIEKVKEGRDKAGEKVVKIVDNVLGKDFGIELNQRPNSPGMIFTIIVPSRLSLLEESERPKSDENGKYILNESGKKIYERYKPEDRRSKPIATSDNFDAIIKHCENVRANIVSTYQKLNRPLPEFKISKYENL